MRVSHGRWHCLHRTRLTCWCPKFNLYINSRWIKCGNNGREWKVKVGRACMSGWFIALMGWGRGEDLHKRRTAGFGPPGQDALLSPRLFWTVSLPSASPPPLLPYSPTIYLICYLQRGVIYWKPQRHIWGSSAVSPKLALESSCFSL